MFTSQKIWGASDQSPILLIIYSSLDSVIKFSNWYEGGI